MVDDWVDVVHYVQTKMTLARTYSAVHEALVTKHHALWWVNVGPAVA